MRRRSDWGRRNGVGVGVRGDGAAGRSRGRADGDELRQKIFKQDYILFAASSNLRFLRLNRRGTGRGRQIRERNPQNSVEERGARRGGGGAARRHKIKGKLGDGRGWINSRGAGSAALAVHLI